mgnify:CR=1 FL=1
MKHDYDRTVTRLITILSKFSHNEIVNPKDLAEEFNVSVRTIQKDLKEKLMPNFPIYMHKKGEYRLSEGASITKSNLTNDEMIILSLALSKFKNVSDFDITTDNLLKKLLKPNLNNPYFMKYEAVKHQGKKGKGNSLDEVGETAGESAKTVQRYIYLAHLSDALLDMVDKKKIGIVQGVELSFLTEQQQEWVQVVLEETGVIISTVQVSRLKEYGKSDELTLPMVRLILTEPKPIERKVTIKADKISRYFPEDYSNEQIENVIYQLLDEWNSSNSEK